MESYLDEWRLAGTRGFNFDLGCRGLSMSMRIVRRRAVMSVASIRCVHVMLDFYRCEGRNTSSFSDRRQLPSPFFLASAASSWALFAA